ncbi:MAG: helix-turn-helix domain-containing protein [Bacillota bacterium]
MKVLVVVYKDDKKKFNYDFLEQLSQRAEILLTSFFREAIENIQSRCYQLAVICTPHNEFPSSWEVNQFSKYTASLILTKEQLHINTLLSLIDVVATEYNPVGEDKLFIQSLRYIHDNLYENDLTLEKVSSQMFVSRHYYSRIFPKKMGIGFKEYIINKRIKKAEILLKTGHTVTYVCYAIGYNDLTYFAKVFKKNVGVNPSTYRQKWRTLSINEWGGISL